MDEHYVAALESAISSVSVLYRDSMAFRRALDYVKEHNRDMYKTLLEIEAEEAGIEI